VKTGAERQTPFLVRASVRKTNTTITQNSGMNLDLIAATGTNEAAKLKRLKSDTICNYCRTFATCLLIVVLTACQPAKKPQIDAKPSGQKAPQPIRYSAAPQKRAPTKLIRFAQTALKSLGYGVGQVDGLWGPRSATAIRKFEREQKIKSAGGHVSELNLQRLEEVSGIAKISFEQAAKKPQKEPGKEVEEGIAAKLDKSVPLTQSPQLIIVDREYRVFAKPNPYSATLTNLAPGTGIYVVSLQEGWYEIESINRLKGYVLAD